MLQGGLVRADAYEWAGVAHADGTGGGGRVDVHLGRQPVFDRDGRVIGHELLFRDSDVTHARISSGAAATAQVILAAFLDLGLDQLVGSGLAFVNLPRPYLVGEIALPVGPGRLVLEVLEDVGHDAQVRHGLQQLRAEGYRLALDDFVFTPQTARLLPEVDFVKLDVLQHGEALPGLVRRCHDAGALVVAEKIETPAQLQMCRDAGVAYFQGYLLQRPEVLRGRSLSATQGACLQLVRLLSSSAATMDEIARLVATDAGLSYRLLRAANSAAFGPAREVTGLRAALVRLGSEQLRRWALLLLVADLPDEAAAAVQAALLRAAMCEDLAGLIRADGQEAFVVGLVSSLDDLLGLSLTELLAVLPLGPVTTAAVLEHAGPLGEVLACVQSYEAGRPAVPAGSGLAADVPRQVFVRALAGQREPVEAR